MSQNIKIKAIMIQGVLDRIQKNRAICSPRGGLRESYDDF